MSIVPNYFRAKLGLTFTSSELNKLQKKLFIFGVKKISNTDILRLDKTIKNTKNTSKKIKSEQILKLSKNYNDDIQDLKNNNAILFAEETKSEYYFKLLSNLGIKKNFTLSDFKLNLSNFNYSSKNVSSALRELKKDMCIELYNNKASNLSLKPFNKLNENEKKLECDKFNRIVNNLEVPSKMYKKICHLLANDSDLLTKMYPNKDFEKKTTRWHQDSICLKITGSKIGVCHGLIVEWANQLKHNNINTENFVKQLNSDSIEIKNQISDLQETQYIRKYKGNLNSELVEKSKEYNFILLDMGYELIEFSKEGLNTNGDFNYYSIVDPNTRSAHSLGSYNEIKDGKEIHTFFDPNFGFVEFTSKLEMQLFINDYVEHNYPAFTERVTDEYLS